jgi:predicted nucleic acid-binding protein
MRDERLRAAWSEVLSVQAIGSCHPQRLEFCRSARNADEYDDMTHMFEDLYPDVIVHKSAWRWANAAQRRLLRHGAHRAMSAVDLLICATAAHHGVVVLHDDNDFATAARHLPDMAERRVRDTPPTSPDVS